MADNADGSGETMLSFKVKTSGDKTHSIEMPDSATVLELKNKLAGPDFENVAADRQRLIYSGRVMKNDDTLRTYKIKPGNTVHMVKSAASNPAPAAATASAPAPAAIPQNMAAGIPANNLLAGLTGARFAGHGINLPGASMFGADGGMGAPPTEDQLADMMADPAVIAAMQAYMDTPQFVEMMIQSNPMLANMPNAREIIRSPAFRRMMTDPEALRQANRLRRMMAGGDAAAAFPAPGVTDTTPGGAPSGNPPAGTNPAQGQPFNPFMAMGGFGGAPGGAGGLPGLASLFGAAPQAGAPQNPASNPAPNPAPTAAAGADSNAQRSAAGATSPPTSAPNNPGQNNPFAALFGGAPGAQAAGAANPNAQNPFGMPGALPVTPEMMQAALRMMGGGGGDNAGQNPPSIPGMPPLSPEMMQQFNPELMREVMQMLQQGSFGGFGVPAAPPDNRPPEEIYAEQLRQLNDMGFFDFDRNVQALRRSGGNVHGAVEHLLNNP